MSNDRQPNNRRDNLGHLEDCPVSADRFADCNCPRPREPKLSRAAKAYVDAIRKVGGSEQDVADAIAAAKRMDHECSEPGRWRESDLSVEGSPPGGNQVPESPLGGKLCQSCGSSACCNEQANRGAPYPDSPDEANNEPDLMARIDELEAERDKLRNALALSICFDCHGEGYVVTVSDPQGDEHGECDTCAGTGRREQDIDELTRLIDGS